MRHLSDTGKQIEDNLRRRLGKPPVAYEAQEEVERTEHEAEELEQPEHPTAAVGAGLMAVVALIIALVLTPVFFVSLFVAMPLAILSAVVLGLWAFSSWEHRRRARLSDDAG